MSVEHWGICASGGAWYIDHRAFRYGEGHLPVVGPQGFYKYLGVSRGCDATDKGCRLPRRIQEPRQRLWSLKRVLTPRFIHSATFSDSTRGTLKDLDGKDHACIRKFLHLPKDIHASTKEGCLGVMSFETSIPALVKNQLDLYSQTLTAMWLSWPRSRLRDQL